MNTTINSDTAGETSTNTMTTNSLSLFERAGKAIKEFATISEIMRLFGAMGVLASMFVFLTQNWAADTDIELFLLMLTQTSLLAVAGFIMFKLLKENKSARLFFGLSLVSITVNFTVLGALFYHSFHLDAPQADYADYARWVVTDTSTLIMATLGSIALLLPLSYFSFSVLSRPAAKKLMTWYFALNLLLLLPLRDPNIILVISLVILVVLVRLLMKKGGDNSLSSWKTLEGKFARIILFAPLFVFILRSMFWYEVNDIAVLMMLTAGYVVMTQLSVVVKGKLNIIAIGLSVIIGAVMAGWAVFVLMNRGNDINIFVSDSLLVPLFLLVFIPACFNIYKRTDEKTIKTILYCLSSIVTAVLLIVNHTAFDTLTTFSIALVASIALLYVAYRQHSTFNLIVSAIMMLIISLVYASEIIAAVMHSGWIGLAISGVSIIILASLLDRYGAMMKMKFLQKKRDFSEV